MPDTLGSPGLLKLIQRLARTGSGALRNRFELFSIEWQQEKARLIALLVCVVACVFLGMMALVLFTGTVIFLVPEDYRLFAAGGFTLLYAGGFVWAWLAIKKRLREDPFPDTMNQLKQDGIWLDSFTTRN